MKHDFDEVVEQTGVFNCMDCGKCTSVCPISLRNNSFSPRKTVVMAVHSGEEQLVADELAWNCLTCNMCTNRCPMGVEFIDFIREMRYRSFDQGNQGNCTHGCTIRTWGEMMAQDGAVTNRLGWLTDDLKTSEEGEYGYFVGCLPLYGNFFTELAPDAVEIARNTVRVLNRLGIEPVVMGDEVCCGHDYLWSGDTKTFLSLAARNVEAIRNRGIQKIITACAECFRTLKVDYQGDEVGLSVDVYHTSEFFLEKIREGTLRIPSGKKNGRVTYHDPCRLSKHMGITFAPRGLLEQVEGLEFKEMPRSGARSVCCGTSLWMNCSWISKEMQIDRLKEAADTGSDTLLTACPKCMIHFRCAMSESDEEINIEVKDLSTLLAESLEEDE
jgi:Fe-S oxidoreductase